MEIRIALDTNRYTDLAGGVREVREKVEQADAVYLPFVALAELRYGFLVGTRLKGNEELLDRFLREPNVAALYPDDHTTRQYADIATQLRRQGTPIPSNDMWIAALCIQHGLTLYARDKHFDHLPQLPRL